MLHPVFRAQRLFARQAGSRRLRALIGGNFTARTKNETHVKIKISTLLFIIVFGMSSLASMARADSASEKEYRLKAAFLYNFVVFVDGPRFKQFGRSSQIGSLDPNKPVLIGILGEDPFGSAFAPLQDREIRNRAVVIKRFKSYSEIVDANDPNIPVHPQFEDIKACHVLFICPSEKSYLDVILKTLGTRAILTVADVPEFLETGGMINFVIDEKKVRFEINTAATARAQLQIRSKLLRLAIRVIKHDALSARDQKENEAKNEAK